MFDRARIELAGHAAMVDHENETSVFRVLCPICGCVSSVREFSTRSTCAHLVDVRVEDPGGVPLFVFRIPTPREERRERSEIASRATLASSDYDTPPIASLSPNRIAGRLPGRSNKIFTAGTLVCAVCVALVIALYASALIEFNEWRSASEFRSASGDRPSPAEPPRTVETGAPTWP